MIIIIRKIADIQQRNFSYYKSPKVIFEKRYGRYEKLFKKLTDIVIENSDS